MQHYANVVLDYIARRDKRTDELREFKLALVTSRILDPFDAFPELRPPDAGENTDVPESTTQDGDPIQTTYVFSEAPEDAQSIEDELRSLLAQSAAGTASFNDSEDDWV